MKASEFREDLATNTKKLFAKFLEGCVSKPVRSIQEFALDEIILPMDGGKHGGQAFSLDYQPYVELLWNELTFGNWSTFVITGPTQSGKTLSAFVIPVLHIVSELKTPCVVGVPDLNMVTDKWREDFEPVMRASPSLVGLIPTKGSGSKEGSVKDAVRLRSGVTMRFMTRGGSDQSKAGFTARHVAITEAAGWSKGTETSKEANPFAQITARQRGTSRFDTDGNISRDRMTIIEGTVTDGNDLPLSARDLSSKSVIYTKHSCGKWIAPEREHFTGYEEAENELDAAESGFFFCPECGEKITEQQRQEMVSEPLLIHDGQRIENDKVVGAPPRTATLFFRWSAFHNLFISSKDIALEEWRALQLEDETPEREEAEKALCQQVWAIAYKPPVLDQVPLDRKTVQRKRDKWAAGVLPPDTEQFATNVET